MCESYGSHSVCMSVCVSATKLAATYLVFESKVQCYKVPYGVKTHVLFGFHRKHFVRQFWGHFADCKLLSGISGISFEYDHCVMPSHRSASYKFQR